MTLMRIREITSCRNHMRTTVVMEDIGGRFTLTFYADRDEAKRLTHEIARAERACHPIYDFIHACLQAVEAVVTRVVLDDVPGEGIGARVYVRQDGMEVGVPCYPPDGLGLALRCKTPVYATPEALAHAEALPEDPSNDDGVRRWVDEVSPGDFS